MLRYLLHSSLLKKKLNCASMSSSIAVTWISSLLFFLLIAYYLIHTYISKSRNKSKPLPPGPKGLPIVGNFFMLGKEVHRDLHRLSTKYGPIMYLRLGSLPTIVVSSAEAAELFLKTHDLNFASRPFSAAAKYISYDHKGFFTEYGPYWRNVRKLSTLKLLNHTKIESFGPMRSSEIELLITSLKDAANLHEIVDITSKIFALNKDMSSLMVFGKKRVESDHDKKSFHEVVQEGMRLAAAPNLAEYIPFVGRFDLQGIEKGMKAVSKVYDDMFDKIIDEHVEVFDKDNLKDFIDVLLDCMASNDTEFSIGRCNIKAIALDILLGSMDTTATAIDWTLTELIKNPRVMRKVQDELEREAGLDRLVEESDIPKLEYLDMVIKETFRLHPVAPLLLPHESIEDCQVNGFFIPKKSRVIINGWAIGRDPQTWTDPEIFMPERFMGKDIDVRGRDFQFLPFGSGRRGCPGLSLGYLVVRLVVAQLVHCFDWELPNNMSPNDLDTNEAFGIVMPRAKHLLVIPKYRLNS
ncbi:hypothetical protein MKX03_006786 [Papaver bracteatum]|nr:hypothetical protein MKX03_006786 [Papaver bracteatum]